ncbi:MAG: Nif3-like dinuclear metal center hexameric protein [Rhodopirellula sp.]|nr:Nif3-like dinuclear metal center hexameric protein [Rhodopirellula sp.]
MTTVAAVVAFLESLAPPHLAEQWDNVGLLVGDQHRDAGRVMTCLTVTPATAAEAVRRRADLIVTHHPLPFRPLKRVTSETTVGRLLLDLISSHVAVCSFHTAFDSARSGINQRLAEGIGLEGIVPLIAAEDGEGTGRCGRLAEPMPLATLVAVVKDLLCLARIQWVGDSAAAIRSLAIGCGAADELLDAARHHGCNAMLLGEARFHTCLEAEAAGIALILPGHFASERFALEQLAGVLAGQFPGVEVWASEDERDPIQVG